MEITHRCDVLRDLVPFARFKKRAKHPLKNVTFSKVAGSSLSFWQNSKNFEMVNSFLNFESHFNLMPYLTYYRCI